MDHRQITPVHTGEVTQPHGSRANPTSRPPSRLVHPRLYAGLILLFLFEPASGFTGVTVTGNPPSPHGYYTATRSLDTTSTLPNLCRGERECGLAVYALSDLWGPVPTDYTSMDRNNDWMFCLNNNDNETLGDVASCLVDNHVSTSVTASDYLPQIYPVKDHALACLSYQQGIHYDASKGNVYCAAVGGPISTCKFDAPSLSGSFHAAAGVIDRTEVALGAVNIKCDADLTLVAGVGGPIDMVQGNRRDPRNVATVDLGAGEGNVLTIKAKQGVTTRIDVKAYVSGNYEAGDVKGTGTITIGTP